jgi:hypothetical protein
VPIVFNIHNFLLISRLEVSGQKSDPQRNLERSKNRPVGVRKGQPSGQPLTYDLRRFPRLEPGVLEGHTANVVIDRFDRRVRYSRMALNMSPSSGAPDLNCLSRPV